MTDKPKFNRDKQKAVLLKTQEKRKQEKRNQVFCAIEEIQKNGQPLTFPMIAKLAGCSVSYLYKWTELTEYIHDLQRKKGQNLNPIDEKTPGQHSLKTLHEAARQRIKELENQVKELKHQNEMLRGHVIEIYDLRDECERLRKQSRELMSELPINKSDKVVPINSISPSSGSPTDFNEEIAAFFNEMGLTLNPKLKREIGKHEPNAVRLSIQAFREYWTKTQVANPEGCLLTMIRDEAKPNALHDKRQDSEPESPQPKATTNNEGRKKVSLGKLKQLSNLFETDDSENPTTER